jgi:putative Mg2+ transporter-C (MgtC) family protein
MVREICRAATGVQASACAARVGAAQRPAATGVQREDRRIPILDMLQNFLADFSDPLPSIAWETALARLLVAAALGGLIGFERETHEKPAGLRTHMMISLAACLFTLLGLEIVAAERFQSDYVRSDPIRLIDAVTAGVAFLAAGSIISSGGSVKGLTTGASMWMVGAIGVACGLGEVMLAASAVVIALIVLWIIGRLEL